MRPRFAARARGSPYSIREEIESSRARKSANLSAVVRAPLYRSSTAPVTRPANQYLMPRYIVSRFRKSIANACASAWQDRVPTIRFVFLPGPDPPSLSRSCRPIAAQRIVRFCFFVFFRRRELNASSLSLVGKNSLENTLIFIREYMLYIQFVRIVLI